jgi:hypothetical protein
MKRKDTGRNGSDRCTRGEAGCTATRPQGLRRQITKLHTIDAIDRPGHRAKDAIEPMEAKKSSDVSFYAAVRESAGRGAAASPASALAADALRYRK